MGTALGLLFWLMKLVPTLQTGPASLPEASKLPASMYTIVLEPARHPCSVPFGMPHLQRQGGHRTANGLVGLKGRRFQPAEETGQCYELAYQRRLPRNMAVELKRWPIDHGCVSTPKTRMRALTDKS
ncbi:hypothetical protein F5883DRAFT_86776 [Diaporthe sp. PMI_573]|jgi:hypothetical protein|nr:hypothetical protein F5883DRAFT_86776 [Diaporthaceae sp. PMI_573]